MKKRITATIEVNKNWEDFKLRCKAEGRSATWQINTWIDAYMARSETIATKPDADWLSREIVAKIRQELPRNLEATRDSIVTTAIAQLNSSPELAAIVKRLIQDTLNGTAVDTSSLNTIESGYSNGLEEGLDSATPTETSSLESSGLEEAAESKPKRYKKPQTLL